MGIAEIQIVGDAERLGATARQVPGRFGHGDLAAFVWVEIDVGRVAVHRQSDEFFGDA